MSAGGDPGRRGAGRDGPERTDLRPRSERRVRRAWREGPGPGLGLAEALYGLAAGLRNLAHDAGLVRTERAAVPVLSVGALSVGGSGKTPVAARAARWAAEGGASPAVVTHGFPDEIAVHRSLNPDVPALGRRDRVRAARRARRSGADLVVLDDGFQHRRLARDLDWVVLDEERVEAGGWRLLPAGRGREPWSSLARADALILARRVARGSDRTGRRDSLPRRLARQLPGADVARCELRPGPLVPANSRAAEADDPAPRVAFASIMKGEDFLQALAGRRPEIEREFLFSDHDPVPDGRLEDMVRLSGGEGMVGTRKDVLKVEERVDDRTPLWCASEEMRWTRGEAPLRRQLSGLGGGP